MKGYFKSTLYFSFPCSVVLFVLLSGLYEGELLYGGGMILMMASSMNFFETTALISMKNTIVLVKMSQ